MSSLALALPFGLLIGLVVGTVGGGGAILALPILVYALGEGVGPASTASLVVVAVAAAVGAGALARGGHVCWRVALGFAAPAAAGSLLGTWANAGVDPRALVLAFVPVMLVAATATWRRASLAGTGADAAPGGCPQPPLARLLVAGGGVGALTGFFGVGGGFAIVPVLTLGLGMGFRRAVATSLVVIVLTGSVAVAAHLAAGADVDVALTGVLALGTALGALAGSGIGGRLPQAALGRAFAVVVATVALALLVDVLVLGGPPRG